MILITVLAGQQTSHSKGASTARHEPSHAQAGPGHLGAPPATTQGPRTLPNVFFLVLLCDRDISAVGFQLMLQNPPESVVLHTESVVQHGRDIVLSVRAGDGCQSDLRYHAAANGMFREQLGEGASLLPDQDTLEEGSSGPGGGRGGQHYEPMTIQGTWLP